MKSNINSHYKAVIYFTAVRWLINSFFLVRLFNLRRKIYKVCKEQSIDIKELLDSVWLCGFSFFVDITGIMNSLNLKFQADDK